MSTLTAAKLEHHKLERLNAAQDRLVAAHFIRQWHGRGYGHGRLTVGRMGEHILLGDGFCALRVGDRHPTFDSRRVIPSLPTDGQALTYAEGSEPKPTGGLSRTWEQFGSQPTVTLVMTPWCYQVSGDTCRVLCRAEPGKFPILVNRILTDLLSTDFYSLRDCYEWRAIPGEGKPVGAFAHQLDGSPLVAIFMPMHATTGPLPAIGT